MSTGHRAELYLAHTDGSYTRITDQDAFLRTWCLIDWLMDLDLDDDQSLRLRASRWQMPEQTHWLH